MTSQDDAQPSDKRSGFWQSESLVLALLPAAGFAFAFVYEAGYLSRFAAPIWLAEIDVTVALSATSMLLLGLGIAHALLSFVPNAPHTLHRFHVGLSLLPVLVALRFIWLTELTLGSHLVGPGLVVVLCVLSSFVSYKNYVAPAERKTPASKGQQTRTKTPWRTFLASDSLADLMWKKAWPLKSQAIVVLAIGTLAAFWLGERKAESQTVFFYSETASCLALRRYGDRILCVGVDSANQRVERRLHLLSGSANDQPLARLFLPRIATISDQRGDTKLFRAKVDTASVIGLTP